MTQRKPVDAWTPRAGVNDKKVGWPERTELGEEGERERGERPIKGENVDRWEDKRDHLEIDG